MHLKACKNKQKQNTPRKQGYCPQRPGLLTVPAATPRDGLQPLPCSVSTLQGVTCRGLWAFSAGPHLTATSPFSFQTTPELHAEDCGNRQFCGYFLNKCIQKYSLSDTHTQFLISLLPGNTGLEWSRLRDREPVWSASGGAGQPTQCPHPPC